MELRHLRAFASVARHRSFSRAAEELLITQPAWNRTIARLEGDLSVPLLDLASRHVEPTETGAELLVHVENAPQDWVLRLRARPVDGRSAGRPRTLTTRPILGVAPLRLCRRDARSCRRSRSAAAAPSAGLLVPGAQQLILTAGG
ncbi:helix-turn-helix domain-containing protein, partial [Streptomyces sp. NRRL S-146]|uniref:helix-turn-helix domain-containing protein n=1 Tax=Streptomyces sp. NRRL S-146 TaxID=1463884 RepID=UPI0004CC78D9